jgi:DNA repair ATPase RecN
LSRLEEANLTVKKLAKFDTPSRVWKDTIKEFLEKGDSNQTWIFNTLSKFASDIDDSLSEFSSALQLMRYVMEELSKELKNRREEIELQDLGDSDTQGKRISCSSILPINIHCCRANSHPC